MFCPYNIKISMYSLIVVVVKSCRARSIARLEIYKAKVPLLDIGILARELIKSKSENARLSIRWFEKGVGLICLLVNHLWRSSSESLILISHSQIDARVILYQKEFLETLKREPRQIWDANISKSVRESLIFTALTNYKPSKLLLGIGGQRQRNCPNLDYCTFIITSTKDADCFRLVSNAWTQFMGLIYLLCFISQSIRYLIGICCYKAAFIMILSETQFQLMHCLLPCIGPHKMLLTVTYDCDSALYVCVVLCSVVIGIWILCGV